MSRLINEDDVIEQIDDWLSSVGYCTIGKGLSYYGELMGCIQDAPTVDAEPVRHGHWIEHKIDRECSECHINSIGSIGRYCSNCGAKMDGERKEE